MLARCTSYRKLRCWFNFAINLCKKALRRRFLAKCKTPRWQRVEMHFKTLPRVTKTKTLATTSQRIMLHDIHADNTRLTSMWLKYTWCQGKRHYTSSNACTRLTSMQAPCHYSCHVTPHAMVHLMIHVMLRVMHHVMLDVKFHVMLHVMPDFMACFMSWFIACFMSSYM